VYSVGCRPLKASPPAPLRMERGVSTEIPLYVLKMFSGPSSISSRLIGVTSHTTPLSIRRGVGGEASVNSVCRRRSVGSNCAQKCSVNSVCSVREKTPQRFVCVLYHTVVAFYFSQKNTQEQNTQIFTETLSQPISQNLTATFSNNALWILYAGAFCGLELCAKNAQWTLCALWEKKLPSVLFVCCIIQW